MKKTVKYRVYELDREDPEADFGSYMFLRRDPIRTGTHKLEFSPEIELVSLTDLMDSLNELLPDGAGPRSLLWPHEASSDIWYRDILDLVVVFELDYA